ncbi:MAG: histidine triad nucleotide-binding protein [Myxococcota bacterium]
MTVFQKIIDRQIPADVVYEDDHVLAFRDVNPVAPVHVLVIPKKPLRNVSDAGAEDVELLGRLLAVAAKVAAREGLDHTGYRVVTNNGRDAGQSVDHLHLHVIGGRSLSWPPG